MVLDKIKSLVRHFRQKLVSHVDNEISREKPRDRPTTGKQPESVSPPQVMDGAAAPTPSSLRASEPTSGLAPELLPPLNFEAETTAESFFKANPTKAARGTFHEVDKVRWDHLEADWSLDDLDIEPPAEYADREHQKPSENSASDNADGALEHLRAFCVAKALAGSTISSVEGSDALCQAFEARASCDRARPERRLQLGHSTRRPAQNTIHFSVLQISKIAARRNWLSPKSSRALTRIGENYGKLDQSERNALNHLLERCGALPEMADHVANLRQAIEL